MAKLAFGAPLRVGLAEGVERTAGVVAGNFGPGGRSTIVEPRTDIPMVMNSGGKILADFSLEEALPRLGSDILLEATKKVARDWGDGVSATAILCRALVQQGGKLLAAGANPIRLREGMLAAARAASESLETMARPVTAEAHYAIARNASGQEDVARLVTQALEQAGAMGEVLVEDSQRRETTLRLGDIRYDYGWAAPEFANDPSHRLAVLRNPYVLLADLVLDDIYSLQTLLEQVSRDRVPLLIIAREIKPAPLRVILMNVKRGNANVVVSLAPGHGEGRRLHMQALAARLDCPLVDEVTGRDLRHRGLELCARVESARIGKEETILAGLPPENLSRLTPLRARVADMLADTAEEYERDKLRLTQSILAGKTVVIQVGGVTEVEMFQRKQSIENALLAIRSAQGGGVLPGGGKGFLMAIPPIQNLSLAGDEALGAKCVVEALKAPVITLCRNAGYPGTAVCQRLLELEGEMGFNARTGQYENMIQSGILDPARTIAGAIRAATETAATLLTAQAAVY